MHIDDIIQAIQDNQVRITDHADEEAEDDRLSLDDIYYSVFQGEMIESYPEERPYPRCLIYGQTPDRIPVHSVWGYNRANQWAVLITVYRPDPARWINWRERRR
jgi:Domain of unknown function (DUF4258)